MPPVPQPWWQIAARLKIECYRKDNCQITVRSSHLQRVTCTSMLHINYCLLIDLLQNYGLSCNALLTGDYNKAI